MDINRQRLPGLRPSSARYMPAEEDAAGLYYPEHAETHHCRSFGRREMAEDYHDPLYAPDHNNNSNMPAAASYQGNWRGRDEVDEYDAPPRRNRGREEDIGGAYRYEESPGYDPYYSREYQAGIPPNSGGRNNYRNQERFCGNARYMVREDAYYDQRGPHLPPPPPPPSYPPARVPDVAVAIAQEEGKVEEGEHVDLVHHDSPFGPAVSVYPKGYIRSQQMKTSPLAPRGGPTPSERRCGFENADAAKIAAFERQTSHFGVPKHHVSVPVIEICPGVFSRLRGAAETKECVRHDFFVPTLCFSCGLEQFCIQDASYVLCPTCRVINPLSGFESSTPTSRFMEDGGVGLGFTMEDLQNLQMELIQDRRGMASNWYRH